MASTPENPESKPKGGLMGMFGKVKDAVSNAVPGNLSMDEIKKKVKSQAESVSASVSDNIKKVDLNKMADKVKDSVNKKKDDPKP
jgi:hypothetical protein